MRFRFIALQVKTYGSRTTIVALSLFKFVNITVRQPLFSQFLGYFDLRYALLHGGVLLLNSGKKVFHTKKRTFSYPGDEFALLGEAEVKVSGLGANVDLAVGTDRRQFDISCNERKMLFLLKHSLRASLSS